MKKVIISLVIIILFITTVIGGYISYIFSQVPPCPKRVPGTDFTMQAYETVDYNEITSENAAYYLYALHDLGYSEVPYLYLDFSKNDQECLGQFESFIANNAKFIQLTHKLLACDYCRFATDMEEPGGCDDDMKLTVIMDLLHFQHSSFIYKITKKQKIDIVSEVDSMLKLARIINSTQNMNLLAASCYWSQIETITKLIHYQLEHNLSLSEKRELLDLLKKVPVTKFSARMMELSMLNYITSSYSMSEEFSNSDKESLTQLIEMTKDVSSHYLKCYDQYDSSGKVGSLGKGITDLYDYGDINNDKLMTYAEIASRLNSDVACRLAVIQMRVMMGPVTDNRLYHLEFQKAMFSATKYVLEKHIELAETGQVTTDVPSYLVNEFTRAKVSGNEIVIKSFSNEISVVVTGGSHAETVKLIIGSK